MPLVPHNTVSMRHIREAVKIMFSINIDTKDFKLRDGHWDNQPESSYYVAVEIEEELVNYLESLGDDGGRQTVSHTTLCRRYN